MVGSFIGIVAGFFGRIVDEIIGTVIDLMLALPGLILIMVVVSLVGSDYWTIGLLIGTLTIPIFARIARSATLSVREREFVQAARLGHGLAEAGHLVLTGGGPGLMEAANLGASFRDGPEALVEACAALAATPSFTPDPGVWAAAGFTVRERWDCSRLSVGVPTWYYGHEPPNVFAGGIAKYFDNAIREDILLRLCGAGIVYSPGRAGTTQEIFQALTRNYYALEELDLRPMVLLGHDYWTRVVPAWPLLKALAKGRIMEPHIHLVDSVDEVLALLG